MLLADGNTGVVRYRNRANRHVERMFFTLKRTHCGCGFLVVGYEVCVRNQTREGVSLTQQQ